MMMIFKNKKKTLTKIHWKDITIAKNKAISDVCNRYSDGEDPMFLYDLMAAVYGKDEEWLNGLKVSEANDYVNTLAFINEKPRQNVAKTHYTLNGHRYVTTMNLQDITTAQYIDFQQMSDKAREMPAEFLSIILIPEGKKYNEGYRIEDVAYDIENYMSVEDCLGLTAFFLALLRMSMQRSLRLLGRMEAKAKREGVMNKEQLEALHQVRLLLESASGMKR